MTSSLVLVTLSLSLSCLVCLSCVEPGTRVRPQRREDKTVPASWTHWCLELRCLCMGTRALASKPGQERD